MVRATGPRYIGGAPIENSPDYLPTGVLGKDFVGARAGEILLLGAVETGEEGVGVNHRQISNEFAAGFGRLSDSGRQRRPACSQYFKTVPGLHFRVQIIGFRVHIVTL